MTCMMHPNGQSNLWTTAQRMGAFVVKDSTIVLNMLIKYKQEFSHNYFFFFFYSFLDPRPRASSHGLVRASFYYGRSWLYSHF